MFHFCGSTQESLAVVVFQLRANANQSVAKHAAVSMHCIIYTRPCKAHAVPAVLCLAVLRLTVLSHAVLCC